MNEILLRITHFKRIQAWAWQFIPVILALNRGRQGDGEFEASEGYRVS